MCSLRLLCVLLLLTSTLRGIFDLGVLCCVFSVCQLFAEVGMSPKEKFVQLPPGAQPEKVPLSRCLLCMIERIVFF